MPLFDMSQVLPGSSSGASLGSAASAILERGESAANSPHSEGRSRERKFVIAPQVAATATATRKARRVSPLLWVGLLAAAGAAGAAVGLHERSMQAVSSEPKQLALPVPTPVVNTEAALPAEAPAGRNERNGQRPANGKRRSACRARRSERRPDDDAQPRAQHDRRGEEQRECAKATKRKSPAVLPSPGSKSRPRPTNPFEAHNAPPPAAPDTEFDPTAARNALTSAAAQASSCRKDGDPSGTANLTITFAPSGRVTSAQIQGPPFSGTATGGCIANTMRHASVPAFSGDHVTVSKTIVIQ